MTAAAVPLARLTVANGEKLEWGRRTYVMGVINVTPDSFSGDGLADDIPAIVDLALRFQSEGADILDVGAESTRPGHQPVPVSEELKRLLPTLEALAKAVKLPISVDTYKAPVAREAVRAGACIINDIWGLKADPGIAEIAAESGAALVLMHNQPEARYSQLLAEVIDSLTGSVTLALDAGVAKDSLIIDPGIGFGKTADHNLEVLNNLERFRLLGYPLLVGSSRKSTLGRLLDLPPDQRVEATAATVAIAITGGADIVRVHDVNAMVRVCRVSDAIVRGWRPAGWQTQQ